MMQQFLKSGCAREAIAREVVAVAREAGHSPAQVALAWLRQLPPADHPDRPALASWPR